MSHRSRRTYLILALAALILLYMLFFSSESSTDFRRTTESALGRKHNSVLRGELSDEDLTARTNGKLQEILDGKDPSLPKSRVILEGTRTEPTAQPLSHDLQDGESEQVPVAGRKTMPKPLAEKPKYPLRDDEEPAYNGPKTEPIVDEGEQLAREELQSILKKSPIIIFSKTYCGFSRKAKNLLLKKYNITPTPYVVELDLMTTPISSKHDDGDHITLGAALQNLLASLTGRKTVPNIMINAQSIGGADDVLRMDGDGTLVEMVRKMGGKRVVGVERVDEEDEKRDKDGKEQKGGKAKEYKV